MHKYKRCTMAALLLCFLCFLNFSLKAEAAQSEDDGKIIFVGDSRALGMYISVTDQWDRTYINTTDEYGNRWSVGSGEGYTWMTEKGVPRIDAEVDARSSVVIMLGINDCLTPSMSDKYISYINAKAAEWKTKGAEIYYVSVNPVRTTTSSGISNEAINQWNLSMQAGLSQDVHYIDTNTPLRGNISFYDDMHYNPVTNRAVYDMVSNVVKDAYRYKQELLSKMLAEKKAREEEEARIAAEQAAALQSFTSQGTAEADAVTQSTAPAAAEFDEEKMNRINAGYLPIYFEVFSPQNMEFAIFLNTKGILCVRLQQDANMIRYLEYAMDMPGGQQGIYQYFEAPLRADGSWLADEAKLLGVYVYDYQTGAVQ